MEKRERFEQILETKGLSDASKEIYLYYYDALSKILAGIDRDLDQEVLDEFINLYKGAAPCRAFLSIYLKMEGRDDLEIPKRTGARKVKKRQYITPEEVDQIGTMLLKKNERWFLMLYLTYECALRRKECVSIMPMDYNWSDWLKDPEKRGKLKITEKGAKRKKERFVIVPSWLMKRIFAYLDHISENLDDQDPMFEIGEIRWHQIFTGTAKKIIGKKLSLHDLRFSKATYWYKQGKDVRQIKIRLGHARIETTYRYIDPAEEEELEEWAKDG